jgi:hypothetical protein
MSKIITDELKSSIFPKAVSSSAKVKCLAVA